jgi:hypothetical protein
MARMKAKIDPPEAPRLATMSIGVYGDETEARIEPFDVVPIDVASWWPPASPP